MDLYNRFTQPGGKGNILTGGAISSGSGSISPDSLVHHITGTGTINTINLPYPGFSGHIYLISDSGFSFDTSGNIGVAGVARAKSVIPFLFDITTNKWYTLPVGFDPPTIFITAPVTGPLAGLSKTITAIATVTAPATLVQAEFFWQDAEGGLHGPVHPIGTALGGSPYSLLWTFPLCAETLGDKVQLTGKVLDSNGMYSTISGSDVLLTGRGC